MVIDTVAAFTLFLLLARITSYITIIIVSPYKCQILRNLKPIVIQLQNLLVWHKAFERFFIKRIGKNLFLCIYDGLQKLYLGISKCLAFKPFKTFRLKARIMYSSHSKRISDFKILILLNTLTPVLVKHITVSSRNGIVVPDIGIALLFKPRIPLPVIAPH